MWRKCNQLQPLPFGAVCKSLKLVASDGLEPPTPAFSEPDSTIRISLIPLIFIFSRSPFPAHLLEQFGTAYWNSPLERAS